MHRNPAVAARRTVVEALFSGGISAIANLMSGSRLAPAAAGLSSKDESPGLIFFFVWAGQSTSGRPSALPDHVSLNTWTRHPEDPASITILYSSAANLAGSALSSAGSAKTQNVRTRAKRTAVDALIGSLACASPPREPVSCCAKN